MHLLLPGRGREILAKDFAGPIQRQHFLLMIDSFAKSLDTLRSVLSPVGLEQTINLYMGIASHLPLVTGLLYLLPQLSIEDLQTGTLSHC